MLGNLIDYINEFGGNDFIQKPFNDVDGLILAQFSYLKMDNILPRVGEDLPNMLLKDIADHPSYEEMYADARYEKNHRCLYEAMAASVRFGNIGLNHYVNLVNQRWEMQFCALCCYLTDGSAFVAFRGTDASVIGWKEDFNMSFMDIIPSQIKAVDYLNYVAERISGKIITGGHSKGGNLAVYCALKCPEPIFDRIERVYSYDGPGFSKDAFKKSEMEKVSGKLKKLVPRSSIVGMLLSNDEDYSVVESKSFGIMQHDPFNWVVDGDDFVYRNDVRESYKLHDEAINTWKENSNPEEIKQFVNNIYYLVDYMGISNLNDISGNIPEILKKFAMGIDSMDEKSRELMKSVFKDLLDTFIDTLKNQSDK